MSNNNQVLAVPMKLICTKYFMCYLSLSAFSVLMLLTMDYGVALLQCTAYIIRSTS